MVILARLARVAAYLWLAGCVGFLLLGIVLTLLPFPVAWPGPAPWSLQSDFVETPDGRVLVCVRLFSEVRCYDRSGAFVRAYPFPKTAGSAQLGVGKENIVYLYEIGYWDEGNVNGFDANWNVVFQEPHATPGARPSPWELSARTGQPQWAPRRRTEARVDRVAQPGDLLFSRTEPHSVFHCADGGTLERHGQTLERRSAAGKLLFTCAEPWPVRLCALPWPGYLAFLAVIVLWLAKRLKPPQDGRLHTTIRARARRLAVKDQENCLRIGWRWFRRGSIRALLISFAWNGFVVGWLSCGFKASDEAFWLMLFFGTPHVLLGAFLLYATLALLVNRTAIRATPEFLTVRNGPVPWYGNRKLAIGELARLHCRQDVDKQDEASGSYSIHALRKDGRAVELVDELSYDQALLIVRKLECHLKTENDPVGPDRDRLAAGRRSTPDSVD